MEPHAAPEQDGSGLVRMFKEGADAIGTHKCAPACRITLRSVLCTTLRCGRANSILLVHSVAQQSPSSALRTRRTKDLFKQLESRSLTAAEEEIIQQRVRHACLLVGACKAAKANVSA